MWGKSSPEPLMVFFLPVWQLLPRMCLCGGWVSMISRWRECVFGDLYVCVCVCVLVNCKHVCFCLCACVFGVFMHVCLCVCVSARACVCVCVFGDLCVYLWLVSILAYLMAYVLVLIGIPWGRMLNVRWCRILTSHPQFSECMIHAQNQIHRGRGYINMLRLHYHSSNQMINT